MKHTTILTILLLSAIITACQPKQIITSFDECVSAGNPVMESNPPQCMANGQIFMGERIVSQPVFHQCTEEEQNNKACTREYDPVCALADNGIRCIKAPCASTDAKTMSTGCTACADQVYGYYDNSCEDIEFVVCNGEAVKGFSPQKYAKEAGSVCVDICPGNYDTFMTQIGIELCIIHYGEEEISDWTTCTKSSESCICAKAYETTRGEGIQNPEYRCVPGPYAERLVFRGGLDSLDENGEQSTMIA
ncbi:MAG: hypothetical protein KKF44_08925 [Nanoarchaeota archaeon]|nr:hypothetical protein [Nanoarchaeota archaeon]